ncbi:MAG TPA: carboxypeptidase-like regulatory domain-containing protein, partial [Puia sp.]
MSKTFLWVLFFIAAFPFPGRSQGRIRGSARGIIADTAGKAPMSDATVSVAPELDTAEAQFAITDKRGGFAFRGLDPGKYHLIITFQGYRHVRKDLVIDAAHRDIDVGMVLMQRAPDLLAEIVVQRPPMQIKQDTIEYNAESFATKPNAVAEDQLKKLPGVQVDASGNITAQGEKVARVLVN